MKGPLSDRFRCSGYSDRTIRTANSTIFKTWRTAIGTARTSNSQHYLNSSDCGNSPNSCYDSRLKFPWFISPDYRGWFWKKWPRRTKPGGDWPIWTQIDQYGPWMTKFDQKGPDRAMTDQFGPKRIKTDREDQFGPKRAITDRDEQFGPKSIWTRLVEDFG